VSTAQEGRNYSAWKRSSTTPRCTCGGNGRRRQDLRRRARADLDLDPPAGRLAANVVWKWLANERRVMSAPLLSNSCIASPASGPGCARMRACTAIATRRGLVPAAGPRVGRVHASPAARTIIAGWTASAASRTSGRCWRAPRRSRPTPGRDHPAARAAARRRPAAERRTPDVAERFARGEREVQAAGSALLRQPMALRIPLWDPDAFLDRYPDWIGLIWSGWGECCGWRSCLPPFFCCLCTGRS